MLCIHVEVDGDNVCESLGQSLSQLLVNVISLVDLKSVAKVGGSNGLDSG